MTDRFITVPDSLELPAAVLVPIARLSDAGTAGRAILNAETTADARTAIGAGTSSLTVGTGAEDAKAGNYQPTAANISDATAAGRGLLTAADVAAQRAVLSLPSTYARAHPGLAPLRETLNAGAASCAVQVLGDSTGNDVTEWAYLVAEDIAADYPNWTVDHRKWSDATQQYDPPTRVQTGTAGDRYLDLSTGTTGRCAPIGAFPYMAGTMDLRVKM